MKLNKHRRCTLTAFGMHHMQSDSRPDKDYLVQVNPGGDHVCTCINYAITRNKYKKAGRADPYYCKHIQRALDKRACDWSTETSAERHKYAAVCPKCLAPTEEYFERPKEVTEADIQATIASMRQQLKELRARNE
jgi:hypothetical protein